LTPITRGICDGEAVMRGWIVSAARHMQQ